MDTNHGRLLLQKSRLQAVEEESPGVTTGKARREKMKNTRIRNLSGGLGRGITSEIALVNTGGNRTAG